MAWIIGIDEAGYGPNLGPFVMSSVACRVPDDLARADLWHLLRTVARRHGEPEDDRLLVADSKLVYSTARGLLGLETGALAALPACAGGLPFSVEQYLGHVGLPSPHEIEGEPWYTGGSPLPVVADTGTCTAAAQRWQQACRQGQVNACLVQSVMVLPARFNEMLERCDSKGAVLAHGLHELLRRNWPAGDEPVAVFVDKHGGRNTYAAMLQEALPAGMVVAEVEGRERSVYRVLGQPREVRLTFQPRADVEHFCVALASMVSKYLREVLMLQFNAFWQQHVPGLKPTAGYPGDAARFLDAIRPAAQRLGISEATLWRRK